MRVVILYVITVSMPLHLDKFAIIIYIHQMHIYEPLAQSNHS